MEQVGTRINLEHKEGEKEKEREKNVFLFHLRRRRRGTGEKGTFKSRKKGSFSPVCEAQPAYEASGPHLKKVERTFFSPFKAVASGHGQKWCKGDVLWVLGVVCSTCFPIFLLYFWAGTKYGTMSLWLMEAKLE